MTLSYRNLLHLSRKLTNRFFLFEELSRLGGKTIISPALASGLFWQSFRHPAHAEDWIPLHRDRLRQRLVAAALNMAVSLLPFGAQSSTPSGQLP